MSMQQFCLRWNNHQPNFISVCSSLLHNNTLVDVTLAAEGRQLQAHKIVLSACSSYFQTLFTTNPCQHPIVILKDVQYDDLKTMVDFMYYGQVNVSQEQLPHILKTAEMLKIKGLAEMPTDPANLTKSDTKTVNEPNEVIGSGAIPQISNVFSGAQGQGGSTGSSESVWSSTDSQFQHQSNQQQLNQQQHHSNQSHQQTQSNHQTQGTQHHQLRRTPSPSGTNASPATRRKRLRKSSNNASGERNTTTEEQTTSAALDGTNTTTGISLSQINQMSFSGSASASSLGGMTGHLHSTKTPKETGTAEIEPHPQDSDSLEDAHGHVHMQIKPEVDISGVQQSIPLDISGANTPSEHDAPNTQSSHSDDISTEANEQQLQQQQREQIQQTTTAKVVRRVLTRQPRVKRDSDSYSNHLATDPQPLTRVSIDFGSSTSSSCYSSSSAQHDRLLQVHSPQYYQQQQQQLSVPSRIERHASEPAPNVGGATSPHLLAVPSTAPFLIKQQSDPLLHSQPLSSPSSGNSSVIGGGGSAVVNALTTLHRQYSHPLPSGSSFNASHSSRDNVLSPADGGILPQRHYISLPESVYSTSSPPLLPPGSSPYLLPTVQTMVVGLTTSNSASKDGNATAITTMSPSTSAAAAAAAINIITTTSNVSSSSSSTAKGKKFGFKDNNNSIDTAMLSRIERDPPPAVVIDSKFRNFKSESSTFTSNKTLQSGSSAALISSSFEHSPTIRVKNEELQRSVSSPQTSREIIILENPRSSHCPVIRPGPALGCNFCWNTIDAHGRILRRKTKYHCPECQTNLCIVPCFQEYHERLNSETTTSNSSSAAAAVANNNNNNNNNKNCLVAANIVAGGGGSSSSNTSVVHN